MENFPLISVIVPVYKVEKYLDQCIASIVAQTYANLEILLVDDGSPDNCGTICDRWAEKDSRIRVIHKENGGAGHARNVALEEARGELIGFIDSDDYIAPQMYSHLYSLMEADVDLTECAIEETEASDLPLDDGSHAQIRKASAVQAMSLHIEDALFRQTPPNKLYRRTAIGDARFPVGNLIDDEFFTYRVIGNCRNLVHSSACMYAYRQQPGSAMNRPFSLKRLEGLKAKQQRLDYLRQWMPELVNEAKLDLLLSSLYALQGSLKNLQGEELARAKEMVSEARAAALPLPGDAVTSLKKRVLLGAMNRSMEGTAKLLNFLIDIHILT